jgi:3-phenylpropionate/trans-cinnamate dioxygenase ferredoxin reductase subunit
MEAVMKNYKYLIIGGGMTAASAVDGIREIDSTGSIGLVSAESDIPYNRPPLTKGLWKGDSLDSIWRRLDDKAAEIHLGVEVKEIDPKQKQVVCDTGDIFTYEKLLMATGGRPRRLQLNDRRVIYYRTLADYYALRSLATTGRRFAVIGGGFIGSEITAALAMNGKEVTMIFPEKGIGGRLFTIQLSQFLSGFYKQKGVEVLAGRTVVNIESRGAKYALRLSDKREILVDGVIAGIGIEPNVELARSIGLDVDNGIIVDEYLRTNQPDIYAAGDVAAFHNPALGKRIRIEHEDNANTMGKHAGWNMAGRATAYHHLPSFYSDLFELGYDAVGILDSNLETFADWERPNEKGVIYYLQDGRVRGVLLWKMGGLVDAARRLIAEKGPFRPKELKGRLTKKEAIAKKA